MLVASTVAISSMETSAVSPEHNASSGSLAEQGSIMT
jgi:hypothetical protein